MSTTHDVTSRVVTEAERKRKEKEERKRKEEEERKREQRRRQRAERKRRTPIIMTPKIVPNRIAVGPDYHLATGLVRSRTQLDRLIEQGRLSFFKIGSRRAQWQDVADRELAALIEQPNEAA